MFYHHRQSTAANRHKIYDIYTTKNEGDAASYEDGYSGERKSFCFYLAKKSISLQTSAYEGRQVVKFELK